MSSPRSIFAYNGNYFDSKGRRVTANKVYGTRHIASHYTQPASPVLRDWCDNSFSSPTESEDSNDDEQSLLLLYFTLKSDTSIMTVNAELTTQGKLASAIRLCLLRNQFLSTYPAYSQAIKATCAKHGLYHAQTDKTADRKPGLFDNREQPIDSQAPAALRLFQQTLQRFSELFENQTTQLRV